MGRGNLCGRMIISNASSILPDLLNKESAVLSCGGMYLNHKRPLESLFEKKFSFQYMFLPNYKKDTLVLKNLKLYRMAGKGEARGKLVKVEKQPKAPVFMQELLKRS